MSELIDKRLVDEAVDAYATGGRSTPRTCTPNS
jgi:hypothetical protein